METIGIRGNTAEELSGLLRAVLEKATWEAMPGGGQMATWASPTGARLTTFVNEAGSMECATPTFAAASRLRARPLGFRDYRDCKYCELLHVDVLDPDGQMVYPLLLQIDDIGVSRARIPMKRPVVLSITAFAEEFRAFPDEKSFNESQTGDEPKFAAQSLIPSGLFGPEPHPHAMITGRVRSAERRVNEVTGVPFAAMMVDTFGGAYDVLAAESVSPEPPAPGSIVQGSFWMVGRVVEGLTDPPSSKGFFGRLFGK